MQSDAKRQKPDVNRRRPGREVIYKRYGLRPEKAYRYTAKTTLHRKTEDLRITALEEALQRAVPVEQVTAVVYHVVLGVMLLWNRPKSAVNILLVVGGIGLSALFGALGLIPFAVLTTRPSNISPEVMKVFE